MGKPSEQQIEIINRNCLKGCYKFAPYLEKLHSKGRSKYPRVIAIPTVRDRIVLIALKEILFQIFPECLPRKLANTYIHEIQKYVEDKDPSQIGVFRTDIKNFYGSINRQRLMEIIKSKTESPKILNLIRRAIETPTVPQNYRRKNLKEYQESEGIPQGLSISNILASIYIDDLDQDMSDRQEEFQYFRYVDDILIFSQPDKLQELKNIVTNKVQNINLSLNDDKTYSTIGNHKFDYLGYSFELPSVTVKQASIDRFIDSIVAKFSGFDKNQENKLRRYPYLTKERLREIFTIQLNEKITGAISGNKRYGWLLYYNAINDLSVLYQIDRIIIRFFQRYFDEMPPPNLKKIAKAYYEGKYDLNGGYIHNYNIYKTSSDKMNFLKERGAIDPQKGYSEEEINEKFESIKAKNLSELERDDANIY